MPKPTNASGVHVSKVLRGDKRITTIAQERLDVTQHTRLTCSTGSTRASKRGGVCRSNESAVVAWQERNSSDFIDNSAL